MSSSDQQKNRQIERMLDQMDELFRGYPLTELEYETPFQCLVAVMLSAQTTDVQVNKVTKGLFAVVRTPQDILDLGAEQLGEYIKTVGLWRSKMKHVMQTAQLLCDKTSEREESSVDLDINPHEPVSKTALIGQHDLQLSLRANNSQEIYTKRGYWLPDTIAGMTQLPGVGIKTAKVVLYILYGQRRVAVDTHVHRVTNRLGIVQTNTPEQTSRLLEHLIPEEYKDIAHRTIIYFGRYLCKAKKPECDRCPLWEVCEWEGKKKRISS